MPWLRGPSVPLIRYSDRAATSCCGVKPRHRSPLCAASPRPSAGRAGLAKRRRCSSGATSPQRRRLAAKRIRPTRPAHHSALRMSPLAQATRKVPGSDGALHPGGLLDATRHLIQELSASPVPVVTYVTPSGARAASAGFFLLQAGDVAAMSPRTNTGAASPVLLGQQMDEVMRHKVENDAAALLRSMTSRRGRNSELAEQTVREAKAFTEREALDNKLIELIAANEQQLFQQLDGREITRWDGHKQVLHTAGATIVEAHRTLREQLMAAIADPNIGFILLVLGALGIYVEFFSP